MSNPTTGEWTAENLASVIGLATPITIEFADLICAAHNAALTAEREKVKRISDFAATVVNAKKDPVAICLNCGEIQHDQIDAICLTCQRAELRSLTDLRSALIAEREAHEGARLMSRDACQAEQLALKAEAAERKRRFVAEEQLAAERNERDIVARSRNVWQLQVAEHGKTIQQLREQIAVAVEALKEIRSRFPVNDEMARIIDAALAKIGK